MCRGYVEIALHHSNEGTPEVVMIDYPEVDLGICFRRFVTLAGQLHDHSHRWFLYPCSPPTARVTAQSANVAPPDLPPTCLLRLALLPKPISKAT
jgi:hypothetical protein